MRGSCWRVPNSGNGRKMPNAVPGFGLRGKRANRIAPKSKDEVHWVGGFGKWNLFFFRSPTNSSTLFAAEEF